MPRAYRLLSRPATGRYGHGIHRRSGRCHCADALDRQLRKSLVGRAWRDQPHFPMIPVIVAPERLRGLHPVTVFSIAVGEILAAAGSTHGRDVVLVLFILLVPSLLVRRRHVCAFLAARFNDGRLFEELRQSNGRRQPQQVQSDDPDEKVDTRALLERTDGGCKCRARAENSEKLRVATSEPIRQALEQNGIVCDARSHPE